MLHQILLGPELIGDNNIVAANGITSALKQPLALFSAFQRGALHGRRWHTQHPFQH